MTKSELVLVGAMVLAASVGACSSSESGRAGGATPPLSDPPLEGDLPDPVSTSSSSGSSSSSSSGSSGATGGASSSGGADEFAVAPTCTGGEGSTSPGLAMRPGEPCKSCHAAFSLAGTVYPTAHETRLCQGVHGGAQVVVTDAQDKTTTLEVNFFGNFYSQDSFSWPIRVNIVAGDRSRSMKTLITQAMGGDCNGCHTTYGAGVPSAPGRILMPK